MAKLYVIKKRNWPGTFRRTVKARNRKGDVIKEKDGTDRIVKVLEFGTEAIELETNDEFEAVCDDIGKALMIADVREDGRAIPSDELTNEFLGVEDDSDEGSADEVDDDDDDQDQDGEGDDDAGGDSNS